MNGGGEIRTLVGGVIPRNGFRDRRTDSDGLRARPKRHLTNAADLQAKTLTCNRPAMRPDRPSNLRGNDWGNVIFKTVLGGPASRETGMKSGDSSV